MCGLVVNDVVEKHELSILNPHRDKKTLGDFFPFVIALVIRVTWYMYMLLAGVGKYLVVLTQIILSHPKYTSNVSLKSL